MMLTIESRVVVWERGKGERTFDSSASIKMSSPILAMHWIIRAKSRRLAGGMVAFSTVAIVLPQTREADVSHSRLHKYQKQSLSIVKFASRSQFVNFGIRETPRSFVKDATGNDHVAGGPVWEPGGDGVLGTAVCRTRNHSRWNACVRHI